MSSRRRRQGKLALTKLRQAQQAEEPRAVGGSPPDEDVMVADSDGETAGGEPDKPIPGFANKKNFGVRKRDKMKQKRQNLLRRLQEQQRQEEEAKAPETNDAFAFGGVVQQEVQKSRNRRRRRRRNAGSAAAPGSKDADSSMEEGLEAFSSSMLEQLETVHNQPSAQERRKDAETRRMRISTRKRVREESLKSFAAVLAHPQFQQAPIEALQGHLRQKAAQAELEEQQREGLERARKRLKRRQELMEDLHPLHGDDF